MRLEDTYIRLTSEMVKLGRSLLLVTEMERLRAIPEVFAPLPGLTMCTLKPEHTKQ
jgi:hypothetical protein